MSGLYVTNTLVIDASPEKVWEILTEPSQTEKYMFGCKTVSDWKVGSPLLWQAFYEGRDTVFVKGFVLEINPPFKLEYSVIDPNGTIPDLPENYLNISYTLEAADDKTVLTVSQGDFSTVAEGQKRYEETFNGGEGWNPILVQVKAIAEETDATE